MQTVKAHVVQQPSAAVQVARPVVQAPKRPVKPPAPKVPKRKRLWDNYRVIGEVQKSNRIKFVIAAGVRDGVKYINIREFYHRQRDGEWRPGRDGITVPLLIPINEGTTIVETYKEFAAMLAQTAETLETMELADEANAIYLEVKQ